MVMVGFCSELVMIKKNNAREAISMVEEEKREMEDDHENKAKR